MMTMSAGERSGGMLNFPLLLATMAVALVFVLIAGATPASAKTKVTLDQKDTISAKQAKAQAHVFRRAGNEARVICAGSLVMRLAVVPALVSKAGRFLAASDSPCEVASTADAIAGELERRAKKGKKVTVRTRLVRDVRRLQFDRCIATFWVAKRAWTMTGPALGGQC